MRTTATLLTVLALLLAACSTDGGDTSVPTDDTTAGQDLAVEPVAPRGQAPQQGDQEVAEEEMADDEMAEGDASRTTESASTGATTPSTSRDAGAPQAPEPPVRFEPATPAEVVPGISPFVAAASDPLSTFALDVDTSSWTQTLTWLAEGQRPPAGIVRPEEFVNWFDYGYDQPDEGWASSVDGVATTPWNDATSLLRIGLVTAALDPAARPDVTLTFVVDTSGSMAGTPLDTVQRSLDLLVTQLRPTDRIGLVEYGSQARTILEPTSLAEADVVRDAIAALQTNGSTNVGDGLRAGYDLARRSRTPGGIDMVVLASDGVANTGVTEAEGILELVGAGVDEGIGLLALGVDERGFNDDLMETLTNRGDGTTYYLRGPQDAERLFVDELEQTLVVAARDSKVQVAFDPEAVSSYRLIGYDNRAVADEDFRNDAVDAGEVGVGHEVTAMYEVELRPGVAADARLADLQLRWQDASSGRVREAARPITVGELTPDAATGFGTAVQAVTLAEVLRGSPYVDVSLGSLAGFTEWGTSSEAAEAIRMAADARPAPGG